MAGVLKPTAGLLYKATTKNTGFAFKRDSFLREYITTPMRPVMWRVYMRDDATTRKNEELFQQWRGVVDFAYRRPHGQVQHPKWMRQAFAEKKFFELDAETSTEKIYLGFNAHYLFSHWSRRGASIPPIRILDMALGFATTVKDLGYATKMLRTYRDHFNVHFEHDLFSTYMAACLRVGCPDCALYALNQARWLGFATVKEQDRQFLQGNLDSIEIGDATFTYEEHVKNALESQTPVDEPVAEVENYSPFAKFWKQHENEQGWWVYPWDKDPNTKLIQHYWRHPSNVDPRHGSAHTEWTGMEIIWIFFLKIYHTYRNSDRYTFGNRCLRSPHRPNRGCGSEISRGARFVLLSTPPKGVQINSNFFFIPHPSTEEAEEEELTQ